MNDRPISSGDSPQAKARDKRIGRPSREQVEEIDRVILETATSMYLRQGPSVPMRAIVEASGLSSKTVYARYRNKETLFPAALRYLLRNAASARRPRLPADGPVQNVIRDFVLQSLETAYLPESMAFHRLLSIDPQLARGLDAEIVEAVDRFFMDPLITYFTSAKAAGLIRAIDVQRTARALATQIIAEPASRYADGSPAPSLAEMEERAAFIADLFFNGIRC